MFEEEILCLSHFLNSVQKLPKLATTAKRATNGPKWLNLVWVGLFTHVRQLKRCKPKTSLSPTFPGQRRSHDQICLFAIKYFRQWVSHSKVLGKYFQRKEILVGSRKCHSLLCFKGHFFLKSYENILGPSCLVHKYT